MHTQTCMVPPGNLHGWTPQLAWLGFPKCMVQLPLLHPMDSKSRHRQVKMTHLPAHHRAVCHGGVCRRHYGAQNHSPAAQKKPPGATHEFRSKRSQSFALSEVRVSLQVKSSFTWSEVHVSLEAKFALHLERSSHFTWSEVHVSLGVKFAGRSRICTVGLVGLHGSASVVAWMG